MVDSIGVTLAGPAEQRTPEESLLLELDELYDPLSAAQRDFMEAIRSLPGADPRLGTASGVEWVRIEGQQVRGTPDSQTLPLQLLPADVWQAFSEMNAAMRADLGRGLLIGSGYRSPANQLSLFVRYMPYYDYSPAKTLPHVSLPGASDHNRIERQGLDFVSESGVDLRYSDAAAFEALEEYRWLFENAARFGFLAEAPDGTSPWHWHFEPVN
jgi:hypothetical protein